MFCKYKNIFGEPNTGIHKKRFLGIALNDLLGTIIIAFLISLIYKTQFILTFVILFIIAQILHIVFCVNTFFVNNIIGLYF